MARRGGIRKGGRWAKAATVASLVSAASALAVNKPITVEVVSTVWVDFGAHCAAYCTQAPFENKLVNPHQPVSPAQQKQQQQQQQQHQGQGGSAVVGPPAVQAQTTQPAKLHYVTLEVPTCDKVGATKTHEAACEGCHGTVFHYKPTDVPFTTITKQGSGRWPTVSTKVPEKDCGCDGTVWIVEPTPGPSNWDENGDGIPDWLQEGGGNGHGIPPWLEGALGNGKGNGHDGGDGFITYSLEGAGPNSPRLTLGPSYPGGPSTVIVGPAEDLNLITVTNPGAGPHAGTRTVLPTSTNGLPLPDASPIAVVGDAHKGDKPILLPGAHRGGPKETLPPSRPGLPPTVVVTDGDDNGTFSPASFDGGDEGSGDGSGNGAGSGNGNGSGSGKGGKGNGNGKGGKGNGKGGNEAGNGDDDNGSFSPASFDGGDDGSGDSGAGDGNGNGNGSGGDNGGDDNGSFSPASFDGGNDGSGDNGAGNGTGNGSGNGNGNGSGNGNGGDNGDDNGSFSPASVDGGSGNGSGNGNSTGSGNDNSTECANPDQDRGMNLGVYFVVPNGLPEPAIIGVTEPRQIVAVENVLSGVPGVRRAYNYRGYFFACSGGKYTVSTPGVDSAIFIWTGDDAVENYSSDNAILSSEDPAALKKRTSPSKEATFDGSGSEFVPIRIVCILEKAGSCLMKIADPDGNTLFDNGPDGNATQNALAPLYRTAPSDTPAFPPFGKENNPDDVDVPSPNPFQSPANDTNAGAVPSSSDQLNAGDDNGTSQDGGSGGAGNGTDTGAAGNGSGSGSGNGDNGDGSSGSGDDNGSGDGSGSGNGSGTSDNGNGPQAEDAHALLSVNATVGHNAADGQDSAASAATTPGAGLTVDAGADVGTPDNLLDAYLNANGGYNNLAKILATLGSSGLNLDAGALDKALGADASLDSSGLKLNANVADSTLADVRAQLTGAGLTAAINLGGPKGGLILQAALQQGKPLLSTNLLDGVESDSRCQGLLNQIACLLGHVVGVAGLTAQGVVNGLGATLGDLLNPKQSS